MKQKKWTTQLQLLHKAKESTQQLTMSTHNSTDHTNIHTLNPDLTVLNQEKWAIIVDIDIAVSFEGNLDTSKEAREAKRLHGTKINYVLADVALNSLRFPVPNLTLILGTAMMMTSSILSSRLSSPSWKWAPSSSRLLSNIVIQCQSN